MNSNQAGLFAFEYQGGRTLTDCLLKVMNVKDYQTLANKLNIPKATISTWHSREQTPFEIISRIHLKTGASMRWLLLGEGEIYEQVTTTIVNIAPNEVDLEHIAPKKETSFGMKVLQASTIMYIMIWSI